MQLNFHNDYIDLISKRKKKEEETSNNKRTMINYFGTPNIESMCARQAKQQIKRKSVPVLLFDELALLRHLQTGSLEEKKLYT